MCTIQDRLFSNPGILPGHTSISPVRESRSRTCITPSCCARMVLWSPLITSTAFSQGQSLIESTCTPVIRLSCPTKSLPEPSSADCAIGRRLLRNWQLPEPRSLYSRHDLCRSEMHGRPSALATRLCPTSSQPEPNPQIASTRKVVRQPPHFSAVAILSGYP